MRLQDRYHQTHRPLEGSLGSRAQAGRRPMPVPRSEAHRLHAHAGSGYSFPGSGGSHGVESGNHRADGEAVRTVFLTRPELADTIIALINTGIETVWNL